MKYVLICERTQYAKIISLKLIEMGFFFHLPVSLQYIFLIVNRWVLVKYFCIFVILESSV